MTSILIVDDDVALAEALAASFTKRGHEVKTAHDVAHAAAIAGGFNPEWALIDLNMPGATGLELIPQLLAIDPATRIVVLTGYASIATAVEAIKLGAVHYLAKPVATDAIIEAFGRSEEGDPSVPVAGENLKFDAAKREHILSAYARNKQNISATARELGMHRRTLQRQLEKLRVS